MSNNSVAVVNWLKEPLTKILNCMVDYGFIMFTMIFAHCQIHNMFACFLLCFKVKVYDLLTWILEFDLLNKAGMINLFDLKKKKAEEAAASSASGSSGPKIAPGLIRVQKGARDAA